MKKLSTFIFFGIMVFGAMAQSYTLRLESGAITPTENAKTFVAPVDITSQPYYCIWQFFATLTEAERQQLTGSGVEIVEYLPYHAYIVGVPNGYKLTSVAGLRAIVPMTAAMKMSRALREPPYPSYATNGDLVDVRVRYFTQQSTLLSKLNAMKIGVLHQNETYRVLVLRVPSALLTEVAAFNEVQYIELIAAPPVKDDRLGRTLARTNLIDAEYAGGRHYTGEGVHVALRDDGEVGQHIDFQNRISQNAEPEANSGTHGDMTGGIMVGAGNLDPTIRGTAAGAYMHVRDYFGNLENDDVLNLHYTDSVVVVSTSYSDGCNAGYTLNTIITETEMYENPSFLHVFSAGNANNQDCDFGAGTVWGNITGGHKVAKNCIATANLMQNGVIDNSSSRGPAHDGRIKPDISANGTDQLSTNGANTYQVGGGTSAASPGIGGTAAQMYQVYRQYHNGDDPDAALIKAILLNTANDIGAEGPDFIYGWGRVNALRGAMLLEEGRHILGTITQGQVPNNHILSIPSGTKQVKFMLYWADAPASASASIALINDLDLTVATPDATILLPWRPNESPNAATLGNAATAGEDHLNNVEQVSITNPATGDYTISVAGFDVPQGPVSYYIVYEIISESVSLTYPVGGEGFEPGETVRIHWDAVANTSSFTLDYSTDDGQNWTNIGVAPAAVRMFDWAVPNVVTGQARVRVTRVNDQDASDVAFNIIGIPTPTVAQACPGQVTISWNSIADADGYRIYQLGEKYMDSLTSVTDTFVNLSIENLSFDLWIAVAATHSSGIKGRRSIALLSKGLVNCILPINAIAIQNAPVATTPACDAASVPVEMTIQNGGQSEITNFEVSYQFDNNPPIVEVFSGSLAAGSTATHTFATPLSVTANISSTLKTWINTTDDGYIYDDTLQTPLSFIIISGSTMPDLEETFEGDNYPPNNWFIANPDNDLTWQKTNTSVIGSDGNPTNSTFINNYSYNSIGQQDRIFSLPINLEGATAPFLTFDLAYAPYNASYDDSLRIEVYTDCSSQYLGTVYAKNATQLATTPASTATFVPTNANQWRLETANLNAYIGQTITLAFVSITGYGNLLHIDNINVLSNLELTPPVADFTIEADTICKNAVLQITNQSSGNLLSYQWTFGVGANPASATGPGPHDVTWTVAGNKNITLNLSNPLETSTLTQVLNVRPTPAANFLFTDTGNGVSFNNISTNANSYLWSFGDNETSTEAEPLHIYALGGTYVVTLTATNNCGDNNKVRTVDATVGTNDASTDPQISIQPNPNNGQFTLLTPQGIAKKATLVAADGRTVRTYTIFASQQVIDASDLPTGAYSLRIITDTGIQTRRILIER